MRVVFTQISKTSSLEPAVTQLQIRESSVSKKWFDESFKGGEIR